MAENDNLQAASQEGGNGKRRTLLLRLSLAFFLLAVAYGAYWYFYAQYRADTDDAYVAGNVIEISPQEAGTVIAVNADDTDLVRAGQPLVKLDATDATIALNQAEAALAETVRQVGQLYDNVGVLQAEVAQRRAAAGKAASDLARRQDLAGTNAVSQEDLAHARVAYKSAQADLAATEQRLKATLALTSNTDLKHHPRVMEAAAKVRQAYVAWRRTVIPAPAGGVIAKRTVQVGQRVAPGAPLMALIPLDQVWVEANFKETQLARLRIGQPVALHADLYGGDVTFHGKVAGLGAGTGAVFALLPPQNASGNWIKIVQRVPVRIALDPEEVKAHPLRVGLSMTATVDTHDTSGPVLPGSAAGESRYATSVFSEADTGADQLVQSIITRNAAASRH